MRRDSLVRSSSESKRRKNAKFGPVFQTFKKTTVFPGHSVFFIVIFTAVNVVAIVIFVIMPCFGKYFLLLLPFLVAL